MRTPFLMVAAALLLAQPAGAEDYEKGPNGGLMLDVAGIDAELLTSGNTVTINVFEAFKAKPVSTKGYVGAALITGGPNRETVALTPQGENSLKGDANYSGRRHDHPNHQDRGGKVGAGKVQEVEGRSRVRS
jgi:hypothetical protein